MAFALAAYAIVWVVAVIAPQVYRPSVLLLSLVLTFLTYPLGRRRTAADAPGPASLPGTPADGAGFRPTTSDGAPRTRWVWPWYRAVDLGLVLLAVVALVWPLVDGPAFITRSATPTVVDRVLGVVLVAVVLEAVRRTTGAALPTVAGAALAYAVTGPWLDRIGLGAIAHRGYSLDRLVGVLYMTLEGIFGVPLDVAATYVVLFTIYGALLEHGGAGRFFVDWARAALGGGASAAAPGRTVTAAGYLLGAVSGSGVANTMMLGSVSWPMMRQGGYPPVTAGALLAGAGIGAILAPPVMGAAAFLVAEFLGVSYFDVIRMAAAPALLYYGALLLVAECDARRLRLAPADGEVPSLAAVTRRGWVHALSLVAIVAAMSRGATAFTAVSWAMLVAWWASLAAREQALTPRRLYAALAAGGAAVVPIVATTAAAGIVVGVLTLTGLGLKTTGLLVALAHGSRVLTVVYAALAVWLLGLAVPVTASYIMGAVMVAPALVQTGIDPAAAHLFVFYYAVLSEVSPPTALSPCAAAAITGASPFRTTMETWRYTLPAFVLPFVFTLGGGGRGLLLQGSTVEVARAIAVSVLGLGAVAVGTGGFLLRPLRTAERMFIVLAGLGVLWFV